MGTDMKKIEQEFITRAAARLGVKVSRLAKIAGIAPSTLNRVVAGKAENFLSLSTLRKIHGVSLEPIPKALLDDGGDRRPPEMMPEIPEPAPRAMARMSATSDLPVRGFTQAGNGHYNFDDTVVEYVTRPPALVGVRGAYALYVRGESMGEHLFERSLVFVHPGQPPSPRELVVVEKTDGGVLVKRLVKRTDGQIILKEYHPIEREIILATSEVKFIHRIVQINAP